MHVGSNTTIGTNDTSINRDLSLGRDLYVVGDISASGYLSTDSHITASGNISSSGYVYGDSIYTNQKVGLWYGSDILYIGYDDSVAAQQYGKNDRPHDFKGNITGSGNLTVAGDISGSGQVYAVSASFGELTNTTNRWTDGSNGNDEFIAVTPGDFILTDTYSRGDEFPSRTTDSGGSIIPASAATNYFAIKMIPKGFTAIEVYIYSDSSDTITVYEGNIANATTTSKGTGNTNTTINITDVDGDGTNYLSIKWNPSSTLDNLYGGKINIQRTA